MTVTVTSIPEVGAARAAVGMRLPRSSSAMARVLRMIAFGCTATMHQGVHHDGAVLVGLVANYVGFLAPKIALGSNILLMVLILLWRPQGLYPVGKS